MGRGRSKAGTNQSKKSSSSIRKDYPEAFNDGVDFQASGDVNHDWRTVSRQLQQQWDKFADPFQTGITAADEKAMMKDWDGTNLYGYVRTTNSMAINAALYDPKNDGKTDAEIFTRKDRRGSKRDLKTVQTLDKAISTHQLPADGSFTRFTSPNAIQAAFGFSDAQMKMLLNAKNMTPKQLKQLNAALKGSRSYSPSYTSTSANRSMNAFGNLKGKMGSKLLFERKINAPKGTNAYAVKKNAQESETIFGRKMFTAFEGISIASDGHIVLHEWFDGYKK